MGLVYTLGQLRNAVEHAIGGVPDSRISSTLVVNRALNHLCNAHPWTWRLVTTTVDFTVDVGDIPLPADFGELLALVGYKAKYTTMRAVTDSDLMYMRVFGMPAWLTFGYCIGIAPQSVPTAAPLYVLKVAPVPNATTLEAMYLQYRKSIPSFGEGDAGTLVPPIPQSQHDTLYQLCRAFAVSMEETAMNDEWTLANASLKRDMDADSRARPMDLGQPRRGPVQEYQRDYSDDSITLGMQVWMPGDP